MFVAIKSDKPGTAPAGSEQDRFDEAKRQAHQGAHNQDAQHYKVAESDP